MNTTMRMYHRFAETLILTFVGISPLCQSAVFRRTSSTTRYLTEATKIASFSLVECCFQCIARTDNHSCTALSFNETLRTCTCGKKGFFPFKNESPEDMALYINTACKKIKRPEADFILVNGGEAGNQRTKSSSLIALDASAASASICSPPGDMIDHRYGHMVAKSGGVLTVCGGSDVAKCEVFDKEQRTWTYTAEGLHQGKGWFPYVSLDDNRIWIGPGSGGSYVCELYDRGTVTSLGGLPTEFNYGPTTPDAGACKLDGDHVILIGGHSNKVFVHEVSTNIWVKKKETLTDVRLAVCSAIDHGPFGKEVILMENAKLDIYSVEKDEWRHGPAIAIDLSYANIIPFGQDGFLVLIDNSLDIYEWDDDAETLIKSDLAQNEMLSSARAVAITAEDLMC